jgi:cytochrome c biogenesis protein CcmG, thiol:disulfide interchange protein DsbE
MRRRWVWVPLLLLAFAGGLAIYGLVRPKDDFIHSAMVGQRLPEFNLPAATGGVSGLRNTDFADGTPRLLNVFASWCIPCRTEAPNLEALKQRGVQIYGVAIRDHPRDVAAFLDRYGNPFALIGADEDMKLQLSLGSSGVPETYVIGGDGTIIYQHIGDIREDHVPVLLAKLAEAR